MFGPRMPFSLSLSKMVGGLSKTLGVINRVIPIYQEAKPLINNARNALNILKELGNKTTNRIITNTNKNMAPIKEKIDNPNANNAHNDKNSSLTFFQ